MRATHVLTAVCLAIGLLLIAGDSQKATAQGGGQGINEGDFRGGRGGGGGFDPEEFRLRRIERTKESLQVTDEEWKALEPLMDAVWDAQADTRFFQFGRRGGRRGGGGGGGGNFPEPPAEVKDLQDVLDKDDATPEEIQAKLKTYREYRDAKMKDLEKARAELKKVLTVKQEAQLVLQGTLE